MNPNTLIENWIKLNVNWPKFNSTIGLRLNSIEKIEMQIGGNILMNIMLKKKLENETNPKKIIPCLFTWEWVKHISN